MVGDLKMSGLISRARCTEKLYRSNGIEGNSPSLSCDVNQEEQVSYPHPQMCCASGGGT